jgi:hypothetical protein
LNIFKSNKKDKSTPKNKNPTSNKRLIEKFRKTLFLESDGIRRRYKQLARPEIMIIIIITFKTTTCPCFEILFSMRFIINTPVLI